MRERERGINKMKKKKLSIIHHGDFDNSLKRQSETHIIIILTFVQNNNAFENCVT
jgi:hypothetical protein